MRVGTVKRKDEAEIWERCCNLSRAVLRENEGHLYATERMRNV